MPKPVAVVDFKLCVPHKCDPKGKCPAVKVCKHKVLKQEKPGEPPFQLGLCQGCGTCVAACPHKAVRLL